MGSLMRFSSTDAARVSPGHLGSWPSVGTQGRLHRGSRTYPLRRLRPLARAMKGGKSAQIETSFRGGALAVTPRK